MRVLLLRYNKVHDSALEVLESKLNKICDAKFGSLPVPSGESPDLLSCQLVGEYLDSIGPIDAIVLGDVFWATGQSLCAVCNDRNIKTFFLQHGQWIYIQNKQSLKHYPSHTLAFGENVANMCHAWPYSRYSNISVVGSPRYDHINGKTCKGSYIYFSPPVIEEIVHNVPSGRIRRPFLKCLESLKGIDDEVPIILQPHYREARTDLLHQLFPKAQFADPGIDPSKLIMGAERVIASRNSTIILDAIAHKKLAIATDLPDDDVCFFRRGHFGEFVLESNSKDDFIYNITSTVRLNARNGYVDRAKKHIFLGNSSERIVELMSNTLATKGII